LLNYKYILAVWHLLQHIKAWEFYLFISSQVYFYVHQPSNSQGFVVFPLVIRLSTQQKALFNPGAILPGGSDGARLRCLAAAPCTSSSCPLAQVQVQRQKSWRLSGQCSFCLLSIGEGQAGCSRGTAASREPPSCGTCRLGLINRQPH